MKDYRGVVYHSIDHLQTREAVATIDDFLRQLNFGVAKIALGETPDASGNTIPALDDYLFLPGRPANQIAHGGTIAGGSLTLVSTRNITRGKVYLGRAQTSAFDEANSLLGIGTSTPSAVGHFVGNPQPGASYIVPDSTQSLPGTWALVGAATFHEAVNEIPFSDTDYVTNNGITGTVGLVHAPDPGAMPAGTTAATLKVRVRRIGSLGTTTFNYGLDRAAGPFAGGFTVSGIVGTSSFVTQLRVLTALELSNFFASSGYVEFAVHSSGINPSDAWEVSGVALELTNASGGVVSTIQILERTATTTLPYQILRDESANDLSIFWDGTTAESATFPDTSGIVVLSSSYDNANNHFIFDTADNTIAFKDHFHVQDQSDNDVEIFCPALSVPQRNITLPNAGNPNATFLAWHDAAGTNTTGGQPLDGSLLYGDGTNSAMLQLAIGASGTILSSTGSLPQWSTLSALTSVEFTDSAFRVIGSSDPTKKLAFEVDGLTAATTRTLTPQNASYTIAGTDISNGFSADQTIAGLLTIRKDAGNSLFFQNVAQDSDRAAIAATGQGMFGDTTDPFTQSSPLRLYQFDMLSGVYVDFSTFNLTAPVTITIPTTSGTMLVSGTILNLDLGTSTILRSSAANTGASFVDNTTNTKRLRMILSSATGNNAFDIRGTSDIYRFPDLGAGTVTMTMAGSIGALTSTRVPFADASGFLTDDADLTFATDTLSATKVAMSSLTSGRVPFASTAGLLVDDADLTFATDTLSATKVAMSSLTSGRVPFASTAGLLIDDADMTFATDTLTVAKEVISTSLQVAGGAVLTALTAGVYTPTLTNVTNVAASTAFEAQYLRVGNTVTVSGRADIDPTLAAVATILGISLPVASNLGANEDCVGIMNGSTGTAEAGYIAADTTNDRASAAIIPTSAANASFYFHFTYQVI